MAFVLPLVFIFGPGAVRLDAPPWNFFHEYTGLLYGTYRRQKWLFNRYFLSLYRNYISATKK